MRPNGSEPAALSEPRKATIVPTLGKDVRFLTIVTHIASYREYASRGGFYSLNALRKLRPPGRSGSRNGSCSSPTPSSNTRSASVSEGLNSKIQTIKQMAYGFRTRITSKRPSTFTVEGSISPHANFGRTILCGLFLGIVEAFPSL